MPLAIGDKAPDFCLKANAGQSFQLSDFKGKKLLLYFYPKDDTPGCTLEAQDFSALKQEFDQAGIAILGVSKDSPAKHDKFIAKYDLQIPLASDEEGQMLENYGVWIEKNLYGRRYMGIERASFLIGLDGHILQIWSKVKVKGHAKATLEAALSL